MYLKTADCQAPASPLHFSIYKPKSFSVFLIGDIFSKTECFVLFLLCFFPTSVLKHGTHVWMQRTSAVLSNTWVQNRRTTADISQATFPFLHLSMMIAFSKRACQHWLVLGNGVVLVVTLLPLCWCQLVVFLSCVWSADGACPEPCTCSCRDQAIRFWASLDHQRWLEKKQLSLYNLVLIPPGSIIHFLVFQVLN